MVARGGTILGLVAGILIGLGSPCHSAPAEWIFASIAPEGSPGGDALDAVARCIERNGAGKIRVKRRNGGILGAEADTLDMLQRGRVQAMIVSLGALVSRVPEVRFLELPYLVPDALARRRVQSRLRHFRHPAMLPLFTARGLFPLGIGFAGWRNVSSARKLIRSPEDLRGLRVRSQPSDLHLAYWRAFGANPRPTELTELAIGLELDLFEAFDVPATWIYATSLHARIRHYALTRHVMQLGVVVVHLDTWNALPQRARAGILADVESMVSDFDQRMMALDEDLIGLLPGTAVTVTQLTAAELDQFRARGRSVEAYVRKTASKDELRLLELTKKIIAGETASPP